jgi:hypothetical protein
MPKKWKGGKMKRGLMSNAWDNAQTTSPKYKPQAKDKSAKYLHKS